jgi:hypothetical protein
MRLMSRSLEITVTWEDINRGTPAHTEWCPVALALRREFPAARVAVGTTFARITTRFRKRSYRFSPEGRDFISTFDAGCPVTPVTFTAVSWR